jgi:small subunit ribosomal protein S16
MAVKIRLSRIGKKKAPFYRVVAIDSRSKRDGEHLDDIGTYDATKSTVVTFNETLYKEWISKGAVVTDSAKKIYRNFKRSNSDALPEAPKAAAVKKTRSKAKAA